MTIIGRIVEEWNELGRGRAVRVNPACTMGIGDIGDDIRCGRPATVRVNYWPHWSKFFCPEHAALFAEPSEFHVGYFDIGIGPELDEPTFIRRRRATS